VSSQVQLVVPVLATSGAHPVRTTAIVSREPVRAVEPETERALVRTATLGLIVQSSAKEVPVTLVLGTVSVTH
jgi:hypothetical protein